MAAGGQLFHSVPGRKKTELEIDSKCLNVTTFMVERRSCQSHFYCSTLGERREEGGEEEKRRHRKDRGRKIKDVGKGGQRNAKKEQRRKRSKDG